MAQKIQLRRDKYDNWVSVNPVLSQGELALDTTNYKLVVGDGVNTFTDLPKMSTSPTTEDTRVINSDTESLGGTSTKQNEINAENVVALKMLYDTIEYDKETKQIFLRKLDGTEETKTLENLATTIEINCTSATEHKYDFILKDVSGTEISKVELDLPLELIKVADFSYDNENEKFILKWNDAQGVEHTIEIPASGILHGVVTETATQTLTNKTINADNNTIQNLETDNLKLGVLDDTTLTATDDTHIASSKLIKTEIDKAGHKLEVAYKNNNLTVKLLDNNDNVLTTKTIEMESIKSMTWDKDNTKIVITKADDTTTDVVLTDVVITDKAQTLTNKAINADNNTITELTGANLKKQATTDKKKTWVVQDDGSWALGKAGSDTDNETIEEANEKLQLKDNGIKFAKLNEDLVVESIRDKDTATDTTLASEKAIRTELDKAGDKLEVNKATDENKINVKLYDKVSNELSSVDILLDDTLKYSDKLYSMPIKEVEALPTENIDQKYLYKLKTENTIYWYDKTEWIALTAKTGMITVESFPTTDIQEGLLYKLTKNVEHTSTDKVYSMVNKEYEFSEETKDGAYTYNSTTDKWYYGTTEITVEDVETLPTATSDNEGKYYDHNSALYLSTGAYKVIVDYYRGVYAYFNGDWQALYSTDVTVSYDNIREESLPTLNGVKIKGDHSSDDYNIYSKSVAKALFQTKEIAKIDEMDATNVEDALKELREFVSKVFKLKGNKDYFKDLPTDASLGDVWVVRYTKDYTWKAQTFTNVETLTNTGIEHLTTTNKWYKDGTEIEVTEVNSFPIANEDYKDKYYYSTVESKLSQCEESDNYTETYTQYYWSADDSKWNVLGKSINTDGMEKVSDATDTLKLANPTYDMDGSALKYNSTNIYCKVVATLNTPVTDIQSADRELITIPEVVKIPDQSINLKVKTHEGQFTANENITELPTTWKKTDYVKTFKDDALGDYYYHKNLTFTSGTDASKTSSGYYWATDTSKMYKDGTAITINTVTTLPEATADIVDKYYFISATKLTIVVACKGIIQDWNANTGALIYDYDGATPRVLNNQDEKQISGGSSLDIYKLKVDDTYGVKIVGYRSISYTNMKGESASVDVPIYEVEKVTVTADEEYIKLCAYANSGLNVNASGVYGHYTIKESDDSKKYSIHSKQYGLVNGFNGEVTFTPDNNSGDWQTVDNAYIKDNKLYIRGDITIDAIRFSETM